MRIGAGHAQVVFVEPSGEWRRTVVTSVEAGRALCAARGVVCHDAWPAGLRRAAGAWPRPAGEWARAPYPERGRAGRRIRRAER